MLKRIDAFAKPREDLRQKSALGGFITLVASMAAGLLFLGQLYLYFTGVTRHSLHLAESQWVPVPTLDETLSTASERAQRASRLPLQLHISFPHLTCSRLDLTHDGMSYKDPKFRQIHGRSATKITTRPLSDSEWRVSTGNGAGTRPSHTDLHQGCSFVASYHIPKVGGAFTVGLSAAAWHEASTFLIMGLNMFNRGGENKQPGGSGGMFNTT